MAVSETVTIDRQRVLELIEREGARLNERTTGSRAMYGRAQRNLSGGVASSYQLRDPWPIYLERGEGPLVWDVDGNRMHDFHNGFGSMVQGHAHPAIGRAVAERYPLGTTSRRRPRTRSSSARSSRAAGACRSGATRTRAPSRRWTPSGSRAPTRAETS
jgi:4-aminobutyrate aminotransferase-like enzyme